MSGAEHPFPWSEDAVCRPPAENVTPPVWCHEHMEPYCPRHAGQPAEDDVAWYETPGDAAYPEPSVENGLQSYVSTLSQRSNWRRVFCKWWGHEYVQVIDPTSVQLRLVCLRCYGGGNQPFRPSLTALLPPAETEAQR